MLDEQECKELDIDYQVYCVLSESFNDDEILEMLAYNTLNGEPLEDVEDE